MFRGSVATASPSLKPCDHGILSAAHSDGRASPQLHKAAAKSPVAVSVFVSGALVEHSELTRPGSLPMWFQSTQDNRGKRIIPTAQRVTFNETSPQSLMPAQVYSSRSLQAGDVQCDASLWLLGERS